MLGNEAWRIDFFTLTKGFHKKAEKVPASGGKFTGPRAVDSGQEDRKI